MLFTKKTPTELNHADWHGFHDLLQQRLIACDYHHPNKTQQEIFELLNQPKNKILIAPTGTGKTLGLIIHLINYGQEHLDQKIFFVLPTKELINQVFDHFKQLNCFKELKVRAVTKNANLNQIIKDNIIITTPEKLLNLRKMMSENHETKTKLVLVLDEVDTLIEMGFLKDVQGFLKSSNSQIISKIAASATIKAGLMNQLKIWFKNYNVLISHQKAAKCQHYYLICREDTKYESLLSVLNSFHDRSGIIIFANSKKKISEINQWIRDNSSWKPVVFHGELTTTQRNQAMKIIAQNEQVLILSTDVLARGISLKHLQVVINFELPKDLNWYMHRSGRTGRYQQPGQVISLIEEKQSSELNFLSKQDITFLKARISQKKLLLTQPKVKKIKPTDPQVDQAIKQILAKAPKKVKPNHKKKLQAAIAKIKKRRKKAVIEKNHREQLLKKWKSESRRKRHQKQQ